MQPPVVKLRSEGFSPTKGSLHSPGQLISCLLIYSINMVHFKDMPVVKLIKATFLLENRKADLGVWASIHKET